MATIRSQIIEYLKNHKSGVDDDQLTRALNLKYRQQANSRCRQLVNDGLVERRIINVKIHNFLLKNRNKRSLTESANNGLVTTQKPWFWEGNVQAVVINYLKERGYIINRCADTASKETGKDIESSKDDNKLWVTVKGYPKGTAKTHPSTQAGHWFKGALFDLLKWRGESKDAILAVAFPDFPRYRKLFRMVQWSQAVIGFSVYWVKEDGSIEEYEVNRLNATQNV